MQIKRTKHTTQTKQRVRTAPLPPVPPLLPATPETQHPLPSDPERKYITFQELSEPAKIYAQHLIEMHYLPASIARQISMHLQEKIAPQEIQKYAEQYAATVIAARNAKERANYLLQRILMAGDDITEILHAAVHETFHYLKENDLVKEMNPLSLEAAHRHRVELALRKKQVEVAERRVQVSEERLQLDRKKARATLRRLERKARRGGSISAKEVDRIRELYGIHEATDRETHIAAEE